MQMPYNVPLIFQREKPKAHSYFPKGGKNILRQFRLLEYNSKKN
jgi:hypothetical protein